MNNAKMTYFEQEDILHLTLSDEAETDSIEISPNITAELNETGELIGIEIIRASSFIRDTILASAQAQLLNLSGSKVSVAALLIQNYQFLYSNILNPCRACTSLQ